MVKLRRTRFLFTFDTNRLIFVLSRTPTLKQRVGYTCQHAVSSFQDSHRVAIDRRSILAARKLLIGNVCSRGRVSTNSASTATPLFLEGFPPPRVNCTGILTVSTSDDGAVQWLQTRAISPPFISGESKCSSAGRPSKWRRNERLGILSRNAIPPARGSRIPADGSRTIVPAPEANSGGARIPESISSYWTQLRRGRCSLSSGSKPEGDTTGSEPTTPGGTSALFSVPTIERLFLDIFATGDVNRCLLFLGSGKYEIVSEKFEYLRIIRDMQDTERLQASLVIIFSDY